MRRADDCFREITTALEASGQAQNKFVMFLSDHGMPLPFAKTQLYHHSTRTPLMVRWPGVSQAGAVDDQHLVSAVDVLPTLLEVMGHRHPKPGLLQGRSFAPLIRGQSQEQRDFVVLQYNENSGGSRQPNCLVNLAGNSDHLQTIGSLRQQLREELQRIADPIAPLLADIENAALRDAG